MVSLSVVVVTLGKRPLFALIDALHEQTDPDFDILFIYPKGEARQILGATVVEQLGEGISDARNTGIAASKGDIVAFTDDDAEPAPDWVAKMKDAFREHPELDYIGGEFTTEGKGVWQRWADARFHMREGSSLCHGNNMAYRRRVFEKATFNPTLTFGADETEFQGRIQRLGFKGKTFSDILIKHEWRGGFWSFTKTYWDYTKGTVRFYKLDGRLLFGWTDMFFMMGLGSVLFGIGFRDIFGVLIGWIVLMMGMARLRKSRKTQPLSFWLIDCYAEMLWTYGKAWHSAWR